MQSKLITQIVAYKSIRNGLLLGALGVLVACQNIAPVSTSDSSGAIPTRSIKPETKVTSIIAPSRSEEAAPVEYDDLWLRMRAGFQLSDVYANESVARQIESYADNQRLFDLVTERAAPFHFSATGM